MGNRIVITESQYGRLFLGEQDYSSKRKVLYDNGVTGLKQNGVETKFIPSYEEISNTPHEKTITTLYNMAGYEMVKDIEWFKEGYLGGSNSMCRWVDLIGYGNSGSNIKGIKLKDLNPDGDLGLKMDNRYGLPTNEYIDGSEKNMKTDFPWMVYWLLSDFRSGGGMSIEQHIIKGNSKILGDNNWIQWLYIVYGTQDINKIKSMITQSQKDNYPIGNYMYSKDISSGCHMERDITGVDKLIKGWDYHDWLDIAAAILFFIPGGQPISLGIEVINAAGYAAEGDFMMGGLGLGLTLLPLGGPLLRRIGSRGIKNINKVVKNTNTFIKSNPKVTKKEVADFITKEGKKLSESELKVLQTVTQKKNINLIQKEVSKLDNLSKKELKTTLTKKSEELKDYLYGYGSKSKYWERQISASLLERTVVSSLILMGVFMGDKSNEEAAKELNDNGYENITPEDVGVMKVDLSELLSTISDFDDDNFEIKEVDESKLKLMNDLNNYLTVADTLGTNSVIYKEQVKPYINNSKILYDIYNIIKTDKELSELEYRELSEDVDYNWYKLLDCEKDPYNNSKIVVANEDIFQTKKYQDDINLDGSPLELRGDSKYEYKEYDDYWFWRLKGSEGKWTLIKNCLACSKLQRKLNKELEEFRHQFDFENEFKGEVEKIKK
jgi:hypothetical protein